MIYTDEGILQFEESDFVYQITDDNYVPLGKVNDKLRKEQMTWPVVYGDVFISSDYYGLKFVDFGNVRDIDKLPNKTQTARLAGVRPIHTETAENVLRELIAAFDPESDKSVTQDLLKRARRVLEGK